MAAVARAIVCEAAPQRAAPPSQQQQQTRRDGVGSGGKIVLQPRLATLRSYGAGGGGRDAVTRKRLPVSGEAVEVGVGDAGRGAPFFASLADYIESTRKSQDFETISGRLAMVRAASLLCSRSVCLALAITAE